MKQKKIMLLGGIRYLLPVIEAAHKEGYYVITVDNVPGNVAHRYSDEYMNVSIVDKEAVLRAAQSRNIDGIMSFGVDPGVVSAAYVQSSMGLPAFGPFESVRILQNKDLFRDFLRQHGFNVPKAKAYSSVAQLMADRDWVNYPSIVKPTDSAGSKGVTKVSSPSQLEMAAKVAFEKSISKHIIVEEFIYPVGCPSDSDCFSIDGRLVFANFNAQRFDASAANPFSPAAYTWPSTFTPQQQEYLRSELQRLITLLGLKTNVYNVETRIGADGRPYIMEFTPRGGGNRLSEIIRYATGVDLITAMTRYIVGDAVGQIAQQEPDGLWAEVILHANRSGRYREMAIAEDLGAEIVETDLWVEPGDRVNAFNGANDAIGTAILRFGNEADMNRFAANTARWFNIVVDPDGDGAPTE